MVIIIKLMTALSGKKKKHSRKRDEILGLIRSTTVHPSARWVYERLKTAFPKLSLGTVYRNIKSFREDGELVSVGVVQGEERFDGRVQPHPHFICSRCGKIIDIDGGMDKTLKEPAVLSPDLYVDHRKTVFYGLCGDCRKAIEEGDTTV
jgi:Fur family peroxide stress response transcriptional regulator